MDNESESVSYGAVCKRCLNGNMAIMDTNGVDRDPITTRHGDRSQNDHSPTDLHKPENPCLDKPRHFFQNAGTKFKKKSYLRIKLLCHLGHRFGIFQGECERL